MNTKTDISAAYVGSTGVDKLYLGNEVVWQNTPPTPVPYDEQYLTIHALDQASLQSNTAYTGGSIYYRTKGSDNWQTLSPGQTLTISPQAPIQLMGNGGANRLFQGGLQSGHYEVYGNIMSLVHGENFIGQTVIPSNLVEAFAYMFAGCSGLVSIKNLVMPATTLSEGCYRSMFNRCFYLTELPDVFVPSAATLSYRCCRYTFEELGASGSTNIDVPSGFIMSTNLANSCYEGMFYNARKLSSAPELPATMLKSNCYYGMFSGCTSLNTITCLATGSSTTYMTAWVANVASTGTFYKSPSATGWTRGISGIPSGWTVQDYDPTPVLKIAGQSIQPDSSSDVWHGWYNLYQYSGTSFTIEVNGVPITADTWEYYEYHMDECGERIEISHETGTTRRSVFEANSGYIEEISYNPNNNFLYYASTDDYPSDDPQYICENCQGGTWDGENCITDEPSCEDQGLCDDGAGNCIPCEDPCDDWENMGYSSWEECKCAQGYGEYCPDPCVDYEGAGYSSYEECTCAERGENCEEESGEPEESGE